MNGAYTQYIKAKGLGRFSSAVEKVNDKHREDCSRRLALLTNGHDPVMVEKLVPRSKRN